MRILIVHADRAMGATLKTAVSKLGHKVQWLQDPGQVVSHLHGNDVDGLLMAIEFPTTSGPDLFFQIEEAYLSKPVGFVTAADVDKKLLAKAMIRGPLLPRVWAKSDLKAMLDELERRSADVSHMQIVQARAGTKTDESPALPLRRPDSEGGPTVVGGAPDLLDPADIQPTAVDPILSAIRRPEAVGIEITNVDPTHVEYTRPESTHVEVTHVEHTGVDRTYVELDDEASSVDQTVVDPSRPEGAPDMETFDKVVPTELPPPPTFGQETHAPKAKVRIVCRQWEQVQGLCNDIKQGITCITVRARAMLDVEQTVTMQIALPDEMVITVDGLVVGSSPWDPDGKRPYQIDLVGFGNDQVFFLQSRCDQVIRSGALGRTTQSIPRTGTPEDRRTRPIRGSKKP